MIGVDETNEAPLGSPGALAVYREIITRWAMARRERQIIRRSIDPALIGRPSETEVSMTTRLRKDQVQALERVAARPAPCAWRRCSTNYVGPALSAGWASLLILPPDVNPLCTIAEAALDGANLALCPEHGGLLKPARLPLIGLPGGKALGGEGHSITDIEEAFRRSWRLTLLQAAIAA